jgi:hypothetical protein
VAIVVVVVMLFPIVLHGWGNPHQPSDYTTLLFPVDLAFAVLIVAAAWPTARRIRSRAAGPGLVIWIVFCIVMSLAWFANPSTRGVHTVFELWGTAALAGTLAEAL